MNVTKSLYQNSWFRLLLPVTILQQGLVASGTYLMGSIASTVSQSTFSLWPALLLLVCVALPGSIVHFAMNWLQTRASKSLGLEYLTQYQRRNFNNPSLWRNAEARQNRHDMMIRTGQDTIQNTVNFWADVLATTLNVILNSISVVLITNSYIGLSILFAGITGILIIHLADQSIGTASQNEAKAEGQLNSTLARSWDNIVLGNSLFFNRWQARFRREFNQLLVSNLSVVRSRELPLAGAAFVTTLIVLIATLSFAYLNQANNAVAIGALVMLPRSLQIVMHLQIIQSFWAQWKGLKQKILITENTLSTPEALDLSQYIKPSEIQLCKNGDSNPVEAATPVHHLLREHSGRFTIRGTNGAGKSTLLVDLKSKLGTRAVYLPAHSQLEIELAENTLSSGEVAMKLLNDTIESKPEILLLDEWDANLSNENVNVIHQRLHEISQHSLVIEVRHQRA